MKFLNHEIEPLGMGCWPIGGAMFAGDESVGYTNVDDAESVRTVHAAYDLGIRLFDTAAAYGAGHAERILATALKDRPDAVITTKIGIPIDEDTKQLSFEGFGPGDVAPAVDACLHRLGRDHIAAVFLHLNELPAAEAEPMFDELEKSVASGKIGAYGWSTDFSASIDAVADRPGFDAVQHAMNVLVDVPRVQGVVAKHGLPALIRSPLAMGVLSGKYDASTVMPADDIRGTANVKTDYYLAGRVNPEMLANLTAVRELLTIGGRSLVQGALGWLWAKSDLNVPIPGARTVGQIEGIAGALRFGALPDDVMAEIETLIEREPADTPDRAR